MFNNFVCKTTFLLNLIFYLINILCLSEYWTRQNERGVFFYKKNLYLIIIVIFIISGLPIGIVFLFKFQLFFFSKILHVLYLLIFFCLINTFFIYFYWKLKLLFRYSLLSKPRQYLMKKYTRHTCWLVKLFIVINITFIINYNFYWILLV